MVYAFTSVTSSYLANARALARSVRKHHPDWKLVLLLNDEDPKGVRWEDECFDEVVHAHELPIPEFRRWAFERTVVEVCTGTKPTMARVLFDERGADSVVYLDPDIAVFSPLEEIPRLLETNDVLLTPHLTDVEDTEYGVWSHEMAALKHGTFNLGFFAIANRKDGRDFLAWWEDRCLKRGQIDFESGLFVDQKWCNLAPYLFDRLHVLCDRTYNVATWNMKNREISESSGEWLVNGAPLRFYHFSGFGRDFSWANEELRAFVKEGTALERLWEWYKDQYQESQSESCDWRWGAFDNGSPILPEDRRRYREEGELRAKYPDPYGAEAFAAIRGTKAEAHASPAAADGPGEGGASRLGSHLRAGARDPRRGVELVRKALSVLRREGWRGIRERLHDSQR